MYNIFSWRGSSKVTNPHGMRRDISNFFRSPSDLTGNVPRDVASATTLGHLFQCFTTLIVKSFFLITYTNLPCFSLKLLPLGLLLQVLLKSFTPFFIKESLKYCKYKVSLEPSLFQAEQCQLSQPFLIVKVLQISDHFCGPSSKPAARGPHPSDAGGPRAAHST